MIFSVLRGRSGCAFVASISSSGTTTSLMLQRSERQPLQCDGLSLRSVLQTLLAHHRALQRALRKLFHDPCKVPLTRIGPWPILPPTHDGDTTASKRN
jgi:hypothetical protein